MAKCMDVLKRSRWKYCHLKKLSQSAGFYGDGFDDLLAQVSIKPFKPLVWALGGVLVLPSVALAQQEQSLPVREDMPKVMSVFNEFTVDKTNFNKTPQAESDLSNISLNQATHQRLQNQQLQEWLNLAQQKNLAAQTIWQRLLYYPAQTKSSQKKNRHSEVTQADFFVAKDGNINPESELQAMLTALAKNDDKAHELICRFPARTHWLKQQLNISDEVIATPEKLSSSNQVCQEYQQWIKQIDPQRMSVVFAEEYLTNPVSAFAHTLLRIDNQKSLEAHQPNSDEFAFALNYTVKGSKNDSFVSYAVNSLKGGYPAITSIEPYPEKINHYLKRDERDVWLYQLDLTPAETQQIMRHVWEVKDINLPYYFLTDNCASEVLRLIDVVRPKQSLFQHISYAAIPSEIIRLLDKNGLIKQAQYVPAEDSIRQATINQQRLQKDTITPQNSVSEQNQFDSIVPANNNPLDGSAVRRLAVSLGHKEQAGEYVQLALRASYHDMLDNPAGVRQFLDLHAVEGSVRVYPQNHHDTLQVEELTLIQARAFNPKIFYPVQAQKSQTSWGGRLKVTRVQDPSTATSTDDKQNRENGQSHLVGDLGAEYGWSWAFGQPLMGSGELPPQLCYVFAAGTAQVGKGLSKGYRIGAGSHLGCRYQIRPNLRTQLEMQLPYWYHGRQAHYWQPITSFGVQYDINKQQAFRLQATHEWNGDIDENNDVNLAWIRYF